MRIAFVHSVYADEGLSGENVTVEQQAQLLAEAGHDVYVVQRRTREEQRQAFYGTRAAWRVVTGRGGSPSAQLRAFRPDVVHVHNLFPNFGTSWLGEWPGPVVATLHNFRYLCSNGLLLRDGQPCTDCPTGSSWSALRHACYHGSRPATMPLAFATRHGAVGNAVVRRADRLVAVADHARDLFVRFGVPAERIDVVPHGIAPRHTGPVTGPAAPRYLVAGRLAPEKGVEQLVREWPAGVALDIVGEGPRADAVHRGAPDGVRLLGGRDVGWRDDAPAYTALIAPGLAIEAAVPRVVIEAWEAGLPVVAHEAGGAATGVRATGAGATYRDAASLLDALAQVEAGGVGLRAIARAAYETSFTPGAWIAAIETTYDRALATGGGRGRPG